MRFSFPLAVLRHVASRSRTSQPYDIVNVHEPSGAALVLNRRSIGQTRVVVTSHGIEERGWALRLTPDANAEERPTWKSRVLYPASVLWQARVALRRADHLFCLNSEDQQYAVGKYGRQKEEITRIFPGAHPVYGENAFRRDYSQAKTILFAGSWLARKGTRELVEAASRVCRRHAGVRFAILNPGKSANDVLADFPPQIRDRVEIWDARPESGTAAAFDKADIFVLPSIFEGTPLTLIEAMWSGLPIISTATCGMRDVLEHGRNGLLVPPRNAEAIASSIEKYLSDSALRESTGRAAHRSASENFGWPTVARIALTAYERVTRAAGRSEASPYSSPSPSLPGQA
jgi:glycosyltransferase involved in cell wall biosynthesis